MFFLTLMIMFLIPSLSFAADPVSAQDLLPPDVIVALLNAMQAIPYVGPVVVFALKMVAIITPIMTALSIAVQAIMAIPELVARYKGLPETASKIKQVSDKIIYWLSILSIRNAKKPEYHG